MRRAEEIQREEGIGPLIAEACAGIEEYVEASRSGRPLDDACTIRTRLFELAPRSYGPEDVKAVREKLRISQSTLAKFLGVTTQTVSYWEQGRRKMSLMARRYLDDLVDVPELWTARAGDGDRSFTRRSAAKRPTGV